LLIIFSFKVGLAWWGKDAIYGAKEEEVWTHGGFMDGVRTHILYEPSTSSGYIILINGECMYNKIEDECRKLMKQLD
jgi:hypothetical protein